MAISAAPPGSVVIIRIGRIGKLGLVSAVIEAIVVRLPIIKIRDSNIFMLNLHFIFLLPRVEVLL